MRVAIPHSLGREEARRRLASRIHELAEFGPSGMAQVTIEWPGENRLQIDVAAMGQNVVAHVDVAESEVVLEVKLPLALAFVEPMIRGAVEAKGRKLLA